MAPRPGWAETYEGWPGLEDSFSITMRYAGMAFPGFYDPLGYWADCGFFGSCGGFYPYYDYAYWGGGGWVEVDPGPPVGGGGRRSGAPQAHGKVVNGLGYTQVSVRPDPAVARIGSGGSGGSSGSSSSGVVRHVWQQRRLARRVLERRKWRRRPDGRAARAGELTERLVRLSAFGYRRSVRHPARARGRRSRRRAGGTEGPALPRSVSLVSRRADLQVRHRRQWVPNAESR